MELAKFSVVLLLNRGFGSLLSYNCASDYPLVVSMVEMTSSARDSRLPLPPEERCGHSHHFVNRYWDFVVETFDEFRVYDSMHESEDSHALWCSFDIPSF
ncbi:hypothetical protein Tco_1053458 [Tanacetum coccineum]